MREDLHEANRQSWNAATRAHNSHKRDQARWLREGGELLFSEDYALLPGLEGVDLLHLQCNSGQDSLCLARKGARVTGVDISDEAIAFARTLADDVGGAAAGFDARFERDDVFAWLPAAAGQGRRFDVVYCSYGALCWLSDLHAWARGVAAVLRDGGSLVVVEFHPVANCFDEAERRSYPYFGGEARAFESPEGIADYVAAAGEALAPSGFEPGEGEFRNPHRAFEFAWSMADILGAIRRAGLDLERFEEYEHCNGCKWFDALEPGGGRRWVFPAGAPTLPLMFGLRARKPGGLALYQVDAFTTEPFAGNPAAVCPLPGDRWPSDARMLAIAAENNLSETAFLLADGDPGRWKIRWFTPVAEMDLCGHATLASGFVVLDALAPDLDEVRFSSRSGELTVGRRGDALAVSLPADPSAPVDDAETVEAIAAALGARPLELHRARYWLATFPSLAAILALEPDFRALAAIGPGEIMVTAPGDPRESGAVDFVSRFFAPSVGIDEDPVTGSAHCALAPFWADRLGKSELRARQVSARGGDLVCRVLDDRVELVGHCARYLVGRIANPL